jgi:hypothetical protein
MDTEGADDQELPKLPNTPTQTLPVPGFNFTISSDPLNPTPFFNQFPPEMSGTRKRAMDSIQNRPSKLPRNVGPQDPRTPGPQEPTQESTQEPSTLEYTTITAILEARDLIILASTLATSHTEQTRLLDLLQIFREYTEKGNLIKASSIITTQIANLESATRQIEQKTRILSKKPKIPVQPPQPTQNTPKSNPNPATYASIVQNAKGDTSNRDWTKIGPKIKTKVAKITKTANLADLAKTTKTAMVLRKAKFQLIVTLPNRLPRAPGPDFSPTTIRNHVNTAFQEKGIKGPVILSVSSSIAGNMILTTTPQFNADFLVENKDIWSQQIKYVKIQKRTIWYKVVAHGIPTYDFNTPTGMDQIIDEVKTFNPGYTPMGKPYWLTSAANRASQRAGSIVIAFPTEEQATKAIKNRLYIAGISVKIEKFEQTAPTSQCSKCGGFGHLASLCKKQATRCLLCSEPHSTDKHYCLICKKEGQKYVHLVPTCINCHEPHVSTDKSCEIYKGLKNTKTTIVEPETLNTTSRGL